eukprot:gene19943-23861_t
MAAVTFKTHLRDGRGKAVADVKLEVSNAGLRLQGEKGLLGHFSFQRILQWAVTEPGCFTFVVMTDAGKRDISLWSSPEEAMGLLKAVEGAVKRLMDQKKQGESSTSKDSAKKEVAPHTPRSWVSLLVDAALRRDLPSAVYDYICS